MTFIDITQKVDADLSATRKLISTTPYIGNGKDTLGPALNLYELVKREYAQNTRLDAEHISLLQTYEQALSVFRMTSQALRQQSDVTTLEQRIATGDTAAQKKLNAASFFANRHALAFAGHVGLYALGGIRKAQEEFHFGANDNIRNYEVVSPIIATQAVSEIAQSTQELKKGGAVPQTENLREILSLTFSTWVNQYKHETFSDVSKEFASFEKLEIKNADYTFTNGAFSAKNTTVDVDDRVMRVTFDDLVGNEDFTATLQSDIRKLLSYDHKEGRNPLDVCGSIFVDGAPGCGKTIRAHAALRYAEQLAKKYNLPAKIGTFSITDFVSHYQNKSAVALAEFAGELRKFPGPCIMYAADVDTIFGKRSPNSTEEEKKVIGTSFKLFDGQLIPKNGKVLWIMDANYVDGIDDATKSRVFDKLYTMKRFEKAEEFAALAKMSLTKGLPLKVEEAEFLKMGKYLLDTNLNNRQIGLVFNQLRGQNVDIAEEQIASLSFKEKQALRLSTIGEVDAQRVINFFTEHEQKIRDMEERTQIERARQKKDELAKMVENLKLQMSPGSQPQ